MSTQDLNITVVAPEDDVAVPVRFQHDHLDLESYFTASPEQPDLAFTPHDGTSSGGYSTPVTPYGTFLDLNSLDTHLSPTDNNLYTPHSPFSPSSLSPAFNGLSLTDGVYPVQNDFNSNFKDMEYSQQEYNTVSAQDQSAFSASRAHLSVVIPGQAASEPNTNISMKDYIHFDEVDLNSLLLADQMPAYNMPDTLPLETNLQRIHRHPHAHARNQSWTPSTAHTNITSPSLCFTPPEFHSGSLLEAPTSYTAEDFILGGGATVQRRHSHTGGKSTSRDERGRSAGRSSAQGSASSSRRSSPYPQPAHSPDTLSPHQIWESGNHLAVPSPIDIGASIPRRHSFSNYSQHSRTPSADSQHGMGMSYQDFQDDSVAADGSAVRKVASQAGIKASEARRTKEAKFACDWCTQTFTTNHNLKNHKNVHLNIKDHPCSRCHRPFTTQSVLARHLKTCKAPTS